MDSSGRRTHAQRQSVGKSKRGRKLQERHGSGYGSEGGDARVGDRDDSCSPLGNQSAIGTGEVDRGWNSRRRDPRVNGADIYVARVTKRGMGSAMPCWRCLEWCRWAGVKRIFHWDADQGKFEVVKVNSAEKEVYETRADLRLYSGLVSLFVHCQHIVYRFVFTGTVMLDSSRNVS